MAEIDVHEQRNRSTPFEQLSQKHLALLEASWAHLFREEILHRLPVDKLRSLYSEATGRPTKELYAMLGIVLFQQMDDLIGTTHNASPPLQ